jgi:hypothetical protein
MATRKQLGWLMRGMIWERSRGMCWYCGSDTVSSPEAMSQASIDHQIPVALGGTDDLENLVLACRECNSEKGAKTADEYRHYVGRQYARVIGDVIDLIEGVQENGWTWAQFSMLAELRDTRSELLRRGVKFHGEMDYTIPDYQI